LGNDANKLLLLKEVACILISMRFDVNVLFEFFSEFVSSTLKDHPCKLYIVFFVR